MLWEEERFIMSQPNGIGGTTSEEVIRLALVMAGLEKRELRNTGRVLRPRVLRRSPRDETLVFGRGIEGRWSGDAILIAPPLQKIPVRVQPSRGDSLVIPDCGNGEVRSLPQFNDCLARLCFAFRIPVKARYHALSHEESVQAGCHSNARAYKAGLWKGQEPFVWYPSYSKVVVLGSQSLESLESCTYGTVRIVRDAQAVVAFAYRRLGDTERRRRKGLPPAQMMLVPVAVYVRPSWEERTPLGVIRTVWADRREIAAWVLAKIQEHTPEFYARHKGDIGPSSPKVRIEFPPSGGRG